MTDDSILESAQRYVDLGVEEARKRGKLPKTYTVVVIGKNGNKPYSLQATDAQDRSDKMTADGVDLSRDHWAAGYVDHNRSLQLAGNDDKAKELVRQHLKPKRR